MISKQGDGAQINRPSNWIVALRDQTVVMIGGLDASTDLLNVRLDINADERLLLEVLDGVTDARESLQDVLDLLDELAGSEYLSDS